MFCMLLSEHRDGGIVKEKKNFKFGGESRGCSSYSDHHNYFPFLYDSLLF